MWADFEAGLVEAARGDVAVRARAAGFAAYLARGAMSPRRAAEELPGWNAAQIDQYICHQVGKAHLTALCDALSIPFARCFPTYMTFGNVGPAAVPLTLALAEEAGRVRPGDHVALMGIGSGLNVSMMSVTW